jgi:AraC-like DNA-binding protein
VTLSSIGFKQDSFETEDDRINIIYDYSLKNFKRSIQLEEIAHVANISPNSFCRYFKSRTRKTYSQFLIEVRVGHACKLLIENNISIKQLCYESGFNNFTSFHKYFKMITGKSPLNYQREFIACN